MTVQTESDKLRAEAEAIIHGLLDIPDGLQSLMVKRLVECIVDAAVYKLRDAYYVDVWNTGYYGVIVPKEKQ